MKKKPPIHLEILLDSYMAELVALIHHRIPGSTVYLFGSRARKDYREGADIDIAIRADTPITIDTISCLYNDLDDTTIPVEVDFVNFDTAGKDFQARILKEGIVWKIPN